MIKNLLLPLLESLGGLGLLLFGMFFINDALQKVAGFKLRKQLVSLTGSPLRGLFTGLVVTVFNQSSTATILLEVSMVTAGLLTFYQTMAVTIGAEIGSTVTAQIVAFQLTDYAVLIAGFGFYLSFLTKTRKWKNIGNAIIGIGIIFLGMKIIADSLTPLRDYQPLAALVETGASPLAGIVIGLVFTAIIHSSGATSVMVIVLALAGVINLSQGVAINLGAQVGTCFTVALGSIGRGREGKRVALWHIIHQTAGVLIIYPFLTVITYNNEPSWLYFIKWFTAKVLGGGDIARQLAMAHSLSAVFNAFIFLPLLVPARMLLCRILPARDEEKPFGPRYIDEELLSTPPLALEQARKEITREGELVLEMLNESLVVFDSRDLKLLETVSLKDIRVDILRNAIVPYLTRVGQGEYLPEELSVEEIQLLYITADLEAIGDVIDKNILPLARKKLENNLWFSDEGWKDIVALHERVTANLVKAITAIRDNNRELAKLVSDSKEEINRYESDLRKRHIERLHSGLTEALETSSIHLDLIDQFKRINSHTATIGYTLIGKM